MQFKDDKGKELPKKVQKKLNSFIDNLKSVNWLKPSLNLKKEDVEKQVKFTLDCFGVKAELEYKKLATATDWNSAWNSAWDSARDSAWSSARASAWVSAWVSAWNSAWNSAWDSAWDSAWVSARASARDSAWDSARASAWNSAEILVANNKDFKSKYPNGAFKQLFKLWEMGLYPVGILKNKKFVIYVPEVDGKYPNLF